MELTQDDLNELADLIKQGYTSGFFDTEDEEEEIGHRISYSIEINKVESH